MVKVKSKSKSKSKSNGNIRGKKKKLNGNGNISRRETIVYEIDSDSSESEYESSEDEQEELPIEQPKLIANQLVRATHNGVAKRQGNRKKKRLTKEEVAQYIEERGFVDMATLQKEFEKLNEKFAHTNQMNDIKKKQDYNFLRFNQME